MARIVAVDDNLRSAVRAAIEDQGLGVTSPELGAGKDTVRSLLRGTQERFNIGKLAELCLSLEMTPGDIERLGYKPLAREMIRQSARLKVTAGGGEYNSALLRSMSPRGDRR
jgi:DNA-binding Xre family transcriptional regulator